MSERERLRDQLIQAVNGNPISTDDAWALIHEWDGAEARLREVEAERDAMFGSKISPIARRYGWKPPEEWRAAEAEVERLRETLLFVEQDSYGRCPVCDAYDPRGHREAGHGNVHGLSCSIGIAVHPRAALGSPPSAEPRVEDATDRETTEDSNAAHIRTCQHEWERRGGELVPVVEYCLKCHHARFPGAVPSSSVEPKETGE